MRDPAAINIYPQVGLVILVGVISRHGMLIVEFVNKLQIEQGLSKRQAIEQATGIRLRPLLMPAAAMVYAMIPLLIAGARRNWRASCRCRYRCR